MSSVAETLKSASQMVNDGGMDHDKEDPEKYQFHAFHEIEQKFVNYVEFLEKRNKVLRDENRK